MADRRVAILVPNLFTRVPVDTAVRGLDAVPVGVATLAEARTSGCRVVVVDLGALPDDAVEGIERFGRRRCDGAGVRTPRRCGAARCGPPCRGCGAGPGGFSRQAPGAARQRSGSALREPRSQVLVRPWRVVMAQLPGGPQRP